MDGFDIIANVLFPLLLDVLYVNDLHDNSDATYLGGLLEVVLLSEGLLLLLKFEELLAFRIYVCSNLRLRTPFPRQIYRDHRVGGTRRPHGL